MRRHNVEPEDFYNAVIEQVEAGRQVGICVIEHPQVDGTSCFATVLPVDRSDKLRGLAYSTDGELRGEMALATVMRARALARELSFTPLPQPSF